MGPFSSLKTSHGVVLFESLLFFDRIARGDLGFSEQELQNDQKIKNKGKSIPILSLDY